ncbi:hypothetical protein Ga0074812_12713 [Parafrankia irregularis]|uniref:Uncharacterized protein n=2 Tax=Frankiaceae TaxID=74712 RepID=A0A0S4QX54_9ACTN|nr:hypothetical protein Ga0074812_12713 [Parafrankia irregularis]
MAGVAVIVTIIMPRLTAGGSQKSGCGVRLTEVGVIDTGGARVYDAVTAPDGRLLALRRNDGVVSLWNVAEPARAVEVGELYVAGAGVVGGMAFGRDGRTLAAVTGDVATVAWWDISDPAAPVVSSTMAGRITIVYTMALSADGRILAIGGLAGAVKAVEFWDVTDPSRPFRAGALEDAVQDGTVDSVAFSPVGRVLAVAGRLGDSAGLWDVTDPARPVRRSTLVGRPANLGDMVAVAFSSDGRTLATAGRFGDEVTLWDVTDPARPRRHGSVVGSTADIASLAFSFDGRLLASASNGSDEIVLMTIEKGVASRASSIDTGEQEADFAAFAAAGCLLVTANADPVVRLWTASR